MKIAIIGSGIAGMGAASLLHPHHEITLYEEAATPGGHARTVDAQFAEERGRGGYGVHRL